MKIMFVVLMHNHELRSDYKYSVFMNNNESESSRHEAIHESCTEHDHEKITMFFGGWVA